MQVGITIAEHHISYRLQRDLERSGYGDHIVVHLHFEQIDLRKRVGWSNYISLLSKIYFELFGQLKDKSRR